MQKYGKYGEGKDLSALKYRMVIENSSTVAHTADVVFAHHHYSVISGKEPSINGGEQQTESNSDMCGGFI